MVYFVLGSGDGCDVVTLTDVAVYKIIVNPDEL